MFLDGSQLVNLEATQNQDSSSCFAPGKPNTLDKGQ